MASSIMHKQLRIGGMTCINCQNKIEKALRNTSGVMEVSVSYDAETADITYDADIISLRDITGVIEALDYDVLQKRNSGRTDVSRIICMVTIIVCLYILLERFGILNMLVPSQLADTGMGYGMLFVIGLITSVHCIAMCGGINLSQCVPREPENAGEKVKLSTVMPSLLYNLGRVASYTLVGFLLGLVGFLIGGGTGLGVSALLQGILKLAAGAFMVIMGVNMLGLFPWMRRLTLRPPKFLVRKIGAQKAGNSGPLVIGLLNGLMPCGPLQSMQIVALASGNPFAGAFSMFLFSLGTVPLMLGLGSVVSILGQKFARVVTTVGSVLVTVLGLAMLSQGGSLSGLLSSGQLLLLMIILCVLGVVASIPFSKKACRIAALAVTACAAVVLLCIHGGWSAGTIGNAAYADSSGVSEVVDGVQVVNSTLSSGRYPNITVQAGTPVKWVIDAPAGSINGCNYKMVLREYGIEHTFQEGENIIEFTPTTEGTFQYSCWMGMIRGNIFVISGDNAEASGDGSAGVPVSAGYQIPSDELAVAEIITDESGTIIQQVTIQLTEDGFQPAVLVVQKEVPALWTIQNSLTTDGGALLLAPYYSTMLDLEQGGNQLSLYPSESFEVSTGDNAFYAYVKVVDDLDQLNIASIQAEVEEYETMIYPAEIFSASGARASCCG